MKTTQAWGWLAAGVLALGLNGFYHDDGAEWAHRIVDRVGSRSAAVLAMSSVHGDRFAARVQTAAARQQTQSCRWATAMARLQTRLARRQAGFARVEAMSARQEATLARLEANRSRSEVQVARVRFVPAVTAMKIPLVCPRVRVQIPRMQIPEVNISAPPAVHVGEDPI